MATRSLEQWCRDLLERAASGVPEMAILLKQCLDDLRPQGGVCHWIYDALDVWRTSCGEQFNLEEGTPADNSIRYCPYCGKPVESTKPEEEQGDK